MTSKYIEELLGLSVAPDMLQLKLFPNSKEITESFGAYAAARDILALDRSDPTIAVLCVGDGHAPRTAATFALRSAWSCFSVDPVMRFKRWNVPRLYTYRDKVASTGHGWHAPRPHFRAYSRAILVAVHSHASLAASVSAAFTLAPQVSIVSMPCCVEQDLDWTTASLVRHDMHITSPHRDVYVWKDAPL